MSMTPRRVGDPFWSRASRALDCAFGCRIAASEWARFGRPIQGQRSVICAPCMDRHYNERPPCAPAPASTPDWKTAAAGDRP
jgi:hypothetical protein